MSQLCKIELNLNLLSELLRAYPKGFDSCKLDKIKLKNSPL